MAEFSFEIIFFLKICLSGIQVGYQTDNAQHFNLNLPSAVDKVISEIALAGKHLILFKFNVYP